MTTEHTPPIDARSMLEAENAQLRASNAALLAALEAVRSDMAEALGAMPVGEMQRGLWEAGVELANAAIKQARGEDA